MARINGTNRRCNFCDRFAVVVETVVTVTAKRLNGDEEYKASVNRGNLCDDCLLRLSQNLSRVTTESL